MIRKAPFSRWKLTAALATAGLLLAVGCCPGYVVRAAFEEGKILAARTPIVEALADPELDAPTRTKLEAVSRARAFAEEIGLNPEGSFSSYAKVDRDVLLWVLVASRPTSFELKRWWFPFVGAVPYRGYFDKELGVRAATQLKAQGYEVSLRPADAFSTLGWFDDPILSTTLRHPLPRVVETVLHENVHSTVWVPGHVPFNETLANFVGTAAAKEMLAREALAQPGDQTAREHAAAADKQLASERHIAAAVWALFGELKALYASATSDEFKLKEREVIFERHMRPLRAELGDLPAFRALNNAELIQLVIYMQDFAAFERAFERCGGSWHCFFGLIRDVESGIDSSSEDPYSLLKRLTERSGQ